jgi:hypothetical protein
MLPFRRTRLAAIIWLVRIPPPLWPRPTLTQAVSAAPDAAHGLVFRQYGCGQDTSPLGPRPTLTHAFSAATTRTGSDLTTMPYRRTRLAVSDADAGLLSGARRKHGTRCAEGRVHHDPPLLPRPTLTQAFSRCAERRVRHDPPLLPRPTLTQAFSAAPDADAPTHGLVDR